MHEQSAVEAIIKTLEEKAPKKAKIKLGMMRGEKSRILDIFNTQVEGTPLAQIDIEIEQVPVTSKCACGFEGTIDIPGHVHFIRCPKCGKIIEPLTGNELEITTE